MSRLIALAAALFVAFVAASIPARAGDLPRAVIGLHDGTYDISSLRLAKAALAHLGLVLEPHAAADPLPDLSNRQDVRGVVIWLDTGAVHDAAALTPWVKALAARDIPVVLMGVPPDVEDRFGLFLSLGLIFAQDERSYTYDLRAVDRDPDIVDFERRFDNLFARTDLVRPLDPAMSRSLLVLQRRGDVPDRTHPLIVTPKGAYAAEGYAVWRQTDGKEVRWFIDPVGFFRLALRMEGVPAPDATTLNARRILAPRLTPAAPSDRTSLPAVLRAVAAIGDAAGLKPSAAVPDDAIEVPARSQLCRDKVRAMLLGYEGFNARLDDQTVPYRIAAAVPTFVICNAERDLMSGAIKAVMQHLAFEPLIPDQGRFEQIQADFAGVRLEAAEPRSWRVRDRGAVQTIRFDDADDLRIDWQTSDGVIGAGRWSGSLYVSLDPDVAEPLVALTDTPWLPPPFPTLIESRWMIERLVRSADTVSMAVTGQGLGDMAWSAAPGSLWEVRLTDQAGAMRRFRTAADVTGLIALSLPPFADGAGTLELRRHQPVAQP